MMFSRHQITAVCAIACIALQSTLGHAALTIVSVTKTGAPTATGAIFGNTVDVLVSSPTALSGSLGSRIIGGTVAGVILGTQVSESMSGANFQYLLRSSALGIGATQGSGTVSLTATDGSGASQIGARTSNLLIDTISPTITLSSTTSTGTMLSGSIRINVGLSEPLSSLILTNFTAVGWVASALTGSGTAYSFTLTPTANTQNSTLSIRVNAGVVTDRLGNLNTASNILSWNYDTLRPTATLTAISPVATRLAGTGSFRLTIPETITGLTPSSFAATGGTITSITGAASPYTVVFTPTALVNSGSISISLPANRVLDRVRLGNTASNTLTWTYDTLPPTLTLASTGAISLANQSNYTLSGLCSENGRTVNITLESVTSAALCISGSWSRTLSTAGAIDGNINLSLTLSDVVGNTTTVTSPITKDTVAPTVSLAPIASVNLTNQNAVTIGGSCSENGYPVTLTANDGVVSITGTGSCSGGMLSGSLALQNLSDGLITFTADTRDAVSNRATQAVRYANKDTVAPTLSLEPPLSINRANVNAAIWSGNCSENGRTVSTTLGTLTGSSICSSNRFTQTLNAATLPDGSYMMTGSLSDLTLNTSSQSTAIIKDTVAPAITLSSLTSSGTTLTGSVLVTLSASEIVTGLTASGITITGGTLGAVSFSGSTGTLTIVPTANTQTGTLSVTYNAGFGVDSVLNPTTQSNTLSWAYDTLLPSFTLLGSQLSGTTLSGAVQLTVTPSEGLLGVQTGSLVVNGGFTTTLSTLGNNYFYAVQPNTLTQSGVLNLMFATGSITDFAFNPLTLTGGLSWEYDTLPPSITGVSFLASGTTDIGFSARYNYTTSESVTSTMRVSTGATQVMIRTATGTTFGNTVFTLSPGETYDYRIIAIDRVGNGSSQTGSFIVPHDVTPESLSFGTENTTSFSTPTLSRTGAVQGISTGIPISVAGGQYQINGGALTAAPGTVRSGDIVALSVTSGWAVGAMSTGSLNIGGMIVPFSVFVISTGAPLPITTGGGGGGGGWSYTPANSTPTSILAPKPWLSTPQVQKTPDQILLAEKATCQLPKKVDISQMSSAYKGHWAEKSIEHALSLSIIKQRQLGSLDRSITRAEFAAMLLRAFPCDTSALTKAKSWSDVGVGSGLEKTLQKLSARGWILGDSGKFRPNDAITRREALEITGRIIGIIPSRVSPSPFSDVTRNDPSFERFVALQKLGVLSGGNLRPNQAITLAETLNYLDTAFWKTNR